jgi:hypothetical protein
VESIKLESGKYEFQYEAGRLICLRHGEPWRELIGDKAVYSLFAFAQSLSEALAGRNITINKLTGELQLATALHSANLAWHEQQGIELGQIGKEFETARDRFRKVLDEL